ncbi:hypothetical protein VNO78_21002 [Psophocarpus tetragonolobus]|uniref:Uncharacterized protein n=1 Tax=Psophocarpus tetragonolobus TaxID=3891 RepID=A0AAN9XHP1_PSOTE
MNPRNQEEVALYTHYCTPHIAAITLPSLLKTKSSTQLLLQHFPCCTPSSHRHSHIVAVTTVIESSPTPKFQKGWLLREALLGMGACFAVTTSGVKWSGPRVTPLLASFFATCGWVASFPESHNDILLDFAGDGFVVAVAKVLKERLVYIDWLVQESVHVE